MKTILRHTFNNGISVRAYAPFLEPGQVLECPAIITSNRGDGTFHDYKGEATIGYDSAHSFLARLDNGKETFISIGIVGAAHWNEKDRIDPKEQRL